jgi:hypothetical protein
MLQLLIEIAIRSWWCLLLFISSLHRLVAKSFCGLGLSCFTLLDGGFDFIKLKLQSRTGVI